MAGPRPMLTNGVGQSQGIWDVRTSPEVAVGTRGSLPDGRVFYYARNSGVALVAGNLVQSEAPATQMDDLVTDTHAAGSTSVNVTPITGVTYDANDFAEGYLHEQSATAAGAGPLYKIKSHAAVSDATEFTVNLYDPLLVAFSAAAKSTLSKNPWQDTVIMGANGTDLCVGVVNNVVPAGSTTKQYYWAQTWGVTCVAADSASAVGDALMRATGTAGQTLIAVAGDQVIGVAYTLGVDGAWCQAFLQIAP